MPRNATVVRRYGPVTVRRTYDDLGLEKAMEVRVNLFPVFLLIVLAVVLAVVAL